jgi:hypothetical protein
MSSTTDSDIVIRPILVQDAEALWKIARQEGVIETTLALPSDRLGTHELLTIPDIRRRPYDIHEPFF